MREAGRGGRRAGARSDARLLSLSELRRWGVLGLAPAVIFSAHFLFGAWLDLPALWMFALLSAVLFVGLLNPASQRDLAHLRPWAALLILFAAVVLVAALSLTTLLPGDPNPLWAWAGLPASSTLNRSATTIEIIKLLGLGAVFVLGCLSGARRDRARAVFGLLLALGAAYALISLVLFLSRSQIVVDPGRLSGGFYSANIAGTQFGVLVILAATWAVRQWGRLSGAAVTEKITAVSPALALILLFTVCLLLTASRAAMVATALALTLFLGWASIDNRKKQWSLMILGGVVIAVAIALFIQGNSLFADRFSSVGSAADERGLVLATHWQAFLDAPLFGYGLGSYAQVNDQMLTSQNYQAMSFTVVLHNAYVQWLEEAGLVGAAPMFALVALILGVTFWGSIQRPRNRTLVVGLLAASLVVLLHAAVDVSLNTPSFAAFWTLILGFGFALSQASSRRG
ncbi:O-antigen ligase family protein [Brevundimonas staleyi]|uniref:O-antigen ligase family protein n=1 Tax=Brevundimonas staleyi TaxID=74326 RepID=A0ABW0FVR6_9CAUL